MEYELRGFLLKLRTLWSTQDAGKSSNDDVSEELALIWLHADRGGALGIFFAIRS